MKNFYLLPGFFLGIVKPPGFSRFILTSASWLIILTNAQSIIRGVGSKPVLVGQKVSLINRGMPCIPIAVSDPAEFLRSHKAYPPGIRYARR